MNMNPSLPVEVLIQKKSWKILRFCLLNHILKSSLEETEVGVIPFNEKSFRTDENEAENTQFSLN